MRTPTSAFMLSTIATSLTGAVAAADSEESEMQDLLLLLEEQTELATQSKMNADYVPGMISILHGLELENQGVRTVGDALNQVAGFYMAVDNAGGKVAIVRGVGASLNATNLKLMLNGTPVNRGVDASADWLFRLPIEQVERIEVIRGPGSSLYGEFAFSGVVNIIPREKARVSVKFGSHQAKQSVLTFNKPLNEQIDVNVNLAAWQQDNSGLASGVDVFADRGLGFISGLRYDHERGLSLLTEFAFDGYKLELQHIDIERGGWYGRDAVIPQELDPRIEQAQGLHLSKTWELSENISLEAKGSARENEVELAASIPIVAGIDPPGPRPPITENVFRQVKDADRLNRASFGIHWQPLENHKIFGEVSYARTKQGEVKRTAFELGEEPIIEADSPGFTRRLTSVTLQDQWQAGESVEVTFGLRHDDYDDWGSHTAPRLALVWRYQDQHIFKFQYADAFRPPTFRQLYPGTLVQPSSPSEESLQSMEMSYIFRESGSRFRATLFYTEVEDLLEFFLEPPNPPIYRNRGELETTGLELEWEEKIDRDLDLFANLSFVDAEDKLDTDSKLTGSVNWLANFGVQWNATETMKHAFQLRLVGEQESWEEQRDGQPPQVYDGHELMNYTFTLDKPFAVDKLKLRFSIDNVAEKTYSISPNPPKYPAGLPLGQRTIWLSLNYDL